MQEVLCVGGSARAPSRSTEPPASKAIRHYSVADRILSFRGVDEPVLDLVHDFLSGYYFTPVDSIELGAQPVHLPAHLIEIHKAPPSALPAPESGFEIEDGYCYPGPEQILLTVNGSTILVGAPELNRTDVWLSETTAGRHPLALNNVILYAVQAALRRANMYQFHAGCVLDGDQARGILLVGDSGSGKSTLTATLVQHGWHFVSDDNLLLRDSSDGVTAWALRRYFTFDQSTLQACDLLQFRSAVGGRVPGDREKIRFYARQAFPQRFVEACRPGVILFPTISGESTSWIEPVSQGDSLARLIRQCPWATCDVAAAPKHLQALTNLVKQTRSYAFSAGRDVFEDSASLPGLITRCTTA